MILNFVLLGGLSFILSVAFTLVVKKVAARFGFMDKPDSDRKIHLRPTPLLGGTAIFLSFWAVTAYLMFSHPSLYGINIFSKKLFGILIASLILIVMGAVDDKKSLSPVFRMGITAVAALIVVKFGMGLPKITNPLGGVLYLPATISGAFVFVWLMAMMYTTKILDGLDGLATGISAIGALVLFFFTNVEKYFQPNVAMLAAIFAGSCLGFLIFNFNPAKIFLGEGGSLFVGLMLGVLAIISGGKVAIALLVMAIPFLDLIRVAYTRFKKGQSVLKGDREHLHFRLVDMELSQRSVVLLLYLAALIFGIAALYLQSLQKIYALIFLILAMICFHFFISRKTV